MNTNNTQKKSISPQKGFAFVQSRLETDGSNGKQITPITFDPKKPVYPIDKEPKNDDSTNAVYIQSETNLRLFVFIDGFPNDFSLEAFNPTKIRKGNLSKIKTIEERDILLEADSVESYYSVMMPLAANRSQEYYEQKYRGKAYLASEWAIYRVSKDMFHYKKCIDGNYNINELKNAKPIQNVEKKNLQITFSNKRTAIVEPRIKQNGEWVENSFLQAQGQDYATNFQDLTPDKKVLVLKKDGKLDLEKSWKNAYDGHEQCNKVGYQYQGVNYLMFFRYVRRNVNEFDKVAYSGAENDCHHLYAQSLVTPNHLEKSRAIFYSFSAATSHEARAMAAGGPPSEGDVAGIPKPE